MKKRDKVFYFLFLFIFSISYLVSDEVYKKNTCKNKSCTGCQTKNVENKAKKNSSSFLIDAPKSGYIDGFVATSCGICNFGYRKNRGCSLTIKIGKKIYPVIGTTISDHGDQHEKEGLCKTIRIAHATGKINKNIFYSDSFVVLDSPEK